MNPTPTSQVLADQHATPEPFRVFFDRCYATTYSSALALSDNDRGIAATITAHAFSRAYARWTVLGRRTAAEAYVERQLSKGLKKGAVTAPTLEAGVGYKPWVYVTAIEKGTTRRRTARFVTGSVAVVAVALAIGSSVRDSSPERDLISISGESNEPALTSSTTSAVIVTTSTTSPPTTELPPLDEPTKFRLDLSGLPESSTATTVIETGPSLTEVPTARTPAPTVSWPAPSRNASSRTTSTTVAPSSVPTPTTNKPATTTTLAPRATIAPTTIAPTTLPPTTVVPTTAAPTTTTTFVPQTTIAPEPTDRDVARAEREKKQAERERARDERKKNN